MIYHTIPADGERKGESIFRSENFNFAKQAAENYKKDTGFNCFVESRTHVFTTSTLEEAMGQGRTHLGALAAGVGDHDWICSQCGEWHSDHSPQPNETRATPQTPPPERGPRLGFDFGYSPDDNLPTLG